MRKMQDKYIQEEWLLDGAEVAADIAEVTARLDQSEGWLYQMDAGGENYGLRKGSNQWDLVDEWSMNHCVRVPRRYAERLEDNWRESWNAGC